jgi:hypothetical protein
MASKNELELWGRLFENTADLDFEVAQFLLDLNFSIADIDNTVDIF